MSSQVVQAGEEPRLREPAHPGQKAEPDVLVAVLDHPVQAAQEVPVRPRNLRVRKRVQDRLVVFVHKHDNRQPGALAQPFDQLPEPQRRAGPHRLQLGASFHRGQLQFHVLPHTVRMAVFPGSKTEPRHRMPDSPVPFAVDGKPPEQVPVALEEFLQRVDQKALPEAPRARQEVMGALLHKTQHVRRLVDVIAVPCPDVPQRLDADGQRAPFHPGKVGPRALGVKRAPRPRRGSNPAGVESTCRKCRPGG